MTFYFSLYLCCWFEWKGLLFWILHYYCMWPDRPQHMDPRVNEKKLYGPLRFIFEYPWSRGLCLQRQRSQSLLSQRNSSLLWLVILQKKKLQSCKHLLKSDLVFFCNHLVLPRPFNSISLWRHPHTSCRHSYTVTANCLEITIHWKDHSFAIIIIKPDCRHIMSSYHVTEGVSAHFLSDLLPRAKSCWVAWQDSDKAVTKAAAPMGKQQCWWLQWWWWCQCVADMSWLSSLKASEF